MMAVCRWINLDMFPGLTKEEMSIRPAEPRRRWLAASLRPQRPAIRQAAAVGKVVLERFAGLGDEGNFTMPIVNASMLNIPA